MTPPERSAEPDAPVDAASGTRTALLVVAGLYALAVVVYLVLAGRQDVPIIRADEFNYGRVARSIADGDGKTLLGAPYALRAALYLYVIAPAWLGDSTTTAYGIAKSIGTVLLCLTVVPTWLLARTMLGARAAIVPAVLVLAGTWMTTGALILTENLALPLATASLAAMVAAVRSPGSRWGWIALAAAAVATWSRMQCVVLVPILFAALLLRAALGDAGFRARLRRDLRLVAVSGGLTALGALVVLVDRSALGNYADLTVFRPGLGRLLSAVGHQGIGLVAMTAILPAILVLAASVRRAAWADDDLGALLAVIWPATLVFAVEGAWLITGFGTWHIQRYIEYVVPLLLIAATVIAARRATPWRDVAAATAVIALLLLLAPPLRNVLEERAAYAIGHRFDQLIGASLPVALALAALIAGGAGAAVLARTAGAERRDAPLLGIGAVVLIVLLAQSQAGWKWQIDHGELKRAALPANLAWIDEATEGPVANLVVTTVSAQWLETSFFNRSVTRVFAPRGAKIGALEVQSCGWGIADDGSLVFGEGCGDAPSQLFIDDPYARATFYDQTVTPGNRFAGELVTVPAAPPRMRAVLQVPCPPVPAGGKSQCLPALSGSFFLDEPGTLIVRFRGGATPQVVTVGARRIAVPARSLTAIRVPVRRGAGSVRLDLSWKGPSPALVSAVLVQGAARTPLL